MFREADIRAYHPKCDATPAEQPRRAKATAPQKSSRSRYAIDPEAIGAGRLPEKAPLVTSAANPHYQKHFDRLFGLAKAGDWDGVRNYEVKGSNSYSKMVARYRQDLLAVRPGFAGRARRFGGRSMSEQEALARFHYGCATRHHKVEIRRLWRSRCMMRAQRSPLTNILIRIRLLRRSRIYTSASAVGLRMVKEI
jgi:hypothetical protein